MKGPTRAFWLRVAAAWLAILAAATGLAVYRSGLAARIALEEEAREDVAGGMAGLPLRDSAAWAAHRAEVDRRIRALEREWMLLGWLWLPLGAAAVAAVVIPLRRRRPR